MKTAWLLPVLALAGCDSRSDPQKDIGTFQAVANPAGAGVYVLDTRDGALNFCMTGPTSGPGSIGITCMPHGEQFYH